MRVTFIRLDRQDEEPVCFDMSCVPRVGDGVDFGSSTMTVAAVYWSLGDVYRDDDEEDEEDMPSATVTLR